MDKNGSEPDDWADGLVAGTLTLDELAVLAQDYVADRHTLGDRAKTVAKLARDAELDHRAGQLKSAEARATVAIAVTGAMNALQPEGGGYLGKLLGVGDSPSDFINRAAYQAHVTLGGLARDRGDLAEAEKHYRAAFESARSVKRGELAQGVALMELGHNLQLQGNNTEAENCLRQAHPMLVRAQGAAYEPLDTYLLAQVLAGQQHWDEAMSLLVQTEDVYSRRNVANGVLDSRLSRVDLLIRTGKLDDAERLATETAQLATQLEKPLYLAHAKWHLSRIKRAHGHPDQAIALLDEAIKLYGQAGDPWRGAQSFMVRAEIQRGEGRIEDADRSLDNATRLARAMKSPFLEADTIHSRALLRLRAGQGAEARRLIETAKQMYASQGRDAQVRDTTAELEKLPG